MCDDRVVVDAKLIRDILEALCENVGASVRAPWDVDKPAPNYVLAQRLGIGRVFGVADQRPEEGEAPEFPETERILGETPDAAVATYMIEAFEAPGPSRMGAANEHDCEDYKTLLAVHGSEKTTRQVYRCRRCCGEWYVDTPREFVPNSTTPSTTAGSVMSPGDPPRSSRDR